MGFPDGKELEKIRKEADGWEGTLHLNEDASPSEYFRWRICQVLLAYKQDNNLKNVELAKKLGIPEADLSRIFHHRIKGISTDRLMALLEKINSKYKIELNVS